MSRHTFLLVDAHALIYRAYFALPNLTDPQGHLVNAVYGFTPLDVVFKDMDHDLIPVSVCQHFFFKDFVAPGRVDRSN